MQTPLVSIIMPAHSVQDFVQETIDSIAAQTSWPLAAGQLSVVHHSNAGAAAAHNTGVALAKGALLGFINADDRRIR